MKTIGKATIRLRVLFLLMLVSVGTVALVLCNPLAQAAPLAQQFNATVIASNATDMRDAHICDCDDEPGDKELYLADQAGDLHQVKKVAGVWVKTLVYNGPGVLQEVEDGDLLPGHPGVELVVGTWNNTQLSAIFPNGAGGWTVQPLASISAQLWGLKVRDVSSLHSGPEVIVGGNMGSSGTRTWLVTDCATACVVTQIAAGGLYHDTGDLTADPGPEIVSLSPGGVYILQGDGTAWTSTRITTLGAGLDQKSIHIDESGAFDPSRPGPKILYDRNQNNVWGEVRELYQDGAGGWVNQVIYRADADEPVWAPTVHHFHMMALVDIDASGQPELVVPHSHVNHAPGRAVLVWTDNGVGQASPMAQGWDEFHKAACDNLDPDIPAIVCVLAGHPTEVVMLAQAP